MKLLKIAPGLIKVPELRVRARLDDETQKLLEQSISEWGIVAPIITCKVGEDIILVDGEHRLNEAKKNGAKEIQVVVFEGDMVDVMTRNIFLDHLRGKTPISDMVKMVKALYEDYHLDIDALSERTFKSRVYVEKLLKISQASPEVLEALDQGAIGVGVAYELARLPAPIMQEEVLAKSTVYRMNVKDVKELVDNVLVEVGNLKKQPPAVSGAEPRPATKYHCEGCKGEVEPKYLRPVMLCPDCFGATWRLAKAQKQVGEATSSERGSS